MEKLEFSYTIGQNEKWYNYFGKQFGSFLQSYVPVNPHLSIYLREMNTLVHTDLYTNVKSICICNSQNLKIIQMSINRWINKLCYIHPMEHSSGMKRNSPLVFATTWILLKIIILSKRNHKNQSKNKWNRD